MKITDEKSYKIQLLRALAIIAVVFIHNTPNEMAQVFCRPFLNFAVGLFLFISGMLSTVDHWNPKKRILKVAIPYFIWTLIYVILYNFKSPTTLPIIFLKNLVTGHASGVMYYIFIYCEFTLLIPLIDKLARSKYKYIGFVISPIEIIVMRLIPLVSGYKINKYISLIMGISCLGWFTYYYLGYLLGNNLLKIKFSTKKLILFWVGGIAIQILEGYWYFSMGEVNCGTQLKLSSILAGSIFVMIAYRFVNSDKKMNVKLLYILGNCSFGIYFSHLAIMAVLSQIPGYSKYVFYPINAIIVVLVSLACVIIGRKILGRCGRYFAL